MMNRLLRDELHLHLYGCLTPEDIFDLGKDHYEERTDALNWYAAEYQRLTDNAVDWRSYFSGMDGPGRISADFLADRPMTFPEFQARFNLMIALLPTVKFAPAVMQRAVHRQARDGIRYAEHRIFVPPQLSKADLAAYFRTLAAAAASLNSELAGESALRIILSVSRTPDLFAQQYAVLKDLQTETDVRTNITGLDFCGIEEGFPPENLTGVFRRVLSDNAANPECALALLYHVGESFDGMSVFSAMRWIHRSASMGAHRLGHAIAAGLPPDGVSRFSDGCRFSEPLSEAAALVDFLEALPDLRPEKSVSALRNLYHKATESAGTDPLSFTWNAELRHAASVLQSAILRDLRAADATIESCPTSNRIIGRIETVSALPAFQFAKAGVPFIISTDDPGIFATTLAQEEDLCRQGGMSENDIARASTYNETRRAGLLAGRGSW